MQPVEAFQAFTSLRMSFQVNLIPLSRKAQASIHPTTPIPCICTLTRTTPESDGHTLVPLGCASLHPSCHHPSKQGQPSPKPGRACGVVFQDQDFLLVLHYE